MFCGHHSLGEGGYTAQQTSVHSVHSVVKNDSAADLHPCSHRLRRLLPSVVGGYAGGDSCRLPLTVFRMLWYNFLDVGKI